MFYKKTSTNYHKWDVFESSESDDEDKEPILPKDDPAFKVMEQDINDRAFRRKRDKKKAVVFKDRGNEMMKKGLYKTANVAYTEALEQARDYLIVYNNRALARLKLQMYQEAVDDCTRVIEYNLAFNEGFEKMPDACYKALIRRAQGYRMMKEWDYMYEDLDEC